MFADFGGANFSSAAFLQQTGGICLYQAIWRKWYDRLKERLFDSDYLGKYILVLSFCLPG